MCLIIAKPYPSYVKSINVATNRSLLRWYRQVPDSVPPTPCRDMSESTSIACSLGPRSRGKVTLIEPGAKRQRNWAFRHSSGRWRTYRQGCGDRVFILEVASVGGMKPSVRSELKLNISRQPESFGILVASICSLECNIREELWSSLWTSLGCGRLRTRPQRKHRQARTRRTQNLLLSKLAMLCMPAHKVAMGRCRRIKMSSVRPLSVTRRWDTTLAGSPSSS